VLGGGGGTMDGRETRGLLFATGLTAGLNAALAAALAPVLAVSPVAGLPGVVFNGADFAVVKG